MKTLLRIIALLLIPAIGFSAPAWKMVPSESSITFTATQNNAPVTGNFKIFTGDISFDPAQLANSHMKIIVDMNSVSTSYGDVATTLKTPDWFDIKKYPQATFTSSSFKKTGDNTYQAEGMLTIRDKTVPITLNFVLEDYSTSRAHAKGSAVIKRTEFNVGQGEWAKTDSVKDEVKIDFTVGAST